MNVYDILEPLVRLSEGLRLKAYQDTAGVWTIGYGHTGPEVVEGLVWNREQVEGALHLDMQDAVEAAAELCPVLADAAHLHKLAAISDFVFNFGAGRLRASTLRRRINDGQFEFVPYELGKWVYARNAKTGAMEKLPGLVNRRNAEIALWSVSNEQVGPATGKRI